ncbi:MAG TPA: alpha/beta hydrolase [Caulobacteraceae bacterium]|jgi:acetyl esterase/lipase
MTDQTAAATPGIVSLKAREVPPPAALSEAARAVLAAVVPLGAPMPAVADKDAWRRLIAQREVSGAQMRESLMARLRADVTAEPKAGVPVYVGKPQGERFLGDDKVVFDIHGGALLFGGGEGSVRFEAAAISLRTGRLTYALDYRVPPDGAYPAALDDCMAVYKALLAERPASQIVLCGTSAGGNLAAALLLRAKDEGLPMPAGALLMTPELDLTESGDTFHTLMGLDTVLTSRLTAMNEVYADGADLAHPYLSPLFGDVAGFPPTLLQAGARDIFLSNAILMHRKLRKAGVRAELHVWEGMPHSGFGGVTPEDREVNAEMQAFIGSL